MTRRDYELIASTIRSTFQTMVAPTQELGWRDREIKCAIVHDLAMALIETNPRFDASRFMAACGKGEQA